MQNKSPVWRDCAIIIGFMALAYLITLGMPGLFPPDEGRYAEIPREMLTTGQWLIPHINGVVYFEKPPLVYWLTTMVMHVFGQSLFAVRFINPILATLGCLFMYAVGRKVFNRRTGLLGALITGSALLYLALGRLLTLDLGVSVFLTVAMGAFLASVSCQTAWGRRGWLWLAYAGAGAAVMTKGLIGVVFPMMIIGAWIWLYHRWAYLKSMSILSGIVIILLINVPWLWAVQDRYPWFLHQYFYIQQFARYATPVASRHMNFFAYVGVLVAGLLPWVIWLPQSIRQVFTAGWRQRHQYQYEGYLLLWGGLIFLFFAPSQSKLITYLLPVVPPFALLIARWLDRHWTQLWQQRLSVSVGVFMAICMLFAVAGVVVPQLPKFIAFTQLQWLLGALSAWMLLVTIGVWWAYRRQRIHALLVWMLLSFAVAGNLIWVSMPMLNQRSILPLAQQLKPLLVRYPNAEVATLSNYYQDLPFYIKRRVVVADWQGELQPGIRHQVSSHKWMISREALMRHWQSHQRVFLLVSNEHYQSDFVQKHIPAYRLGHTTRVSLVANFLVGR